MAVEFSYEKEWRMNKKIFGGGELLDQGSHLIDLSMMFLGKVISHKSKLTTNFWKTDVDDNAFLILEFHKMIKKFLLFMPHALSGKITLLLKYMENLEK